MATELIFQLDLTHEQLLLYYQGQARNVVVTTLQGTRIQFPAEQLRQFITPQGVQGVFSITFDDDNKLIDLRLH